MGQQEETIKPTGLKHWSRLVAKFLSVQIVVQVLAGVASIILIRALSKEEYAYYTISNSMQGTISLLADMGLSAGLVSIGGKVWEDRKRFGQLLHTAFRIRLVMGLIAGAVVLPILVYLLYKNGATSVYIGVILIIFCLLLFFQLQVNILTIVPRIYAQINKIQKMDLMSAVFRFVFIAVAAYSFINTPVIIAITVGSFALQYYYLNTFVYKTIEQGNTIHLEDKKDLLVLIKSQAANGIFFCIQGQITTWLISIFGNVNQIAEIGALGRMEMIYILISTTINAIFIPMYAKAQKKEEIWKIYKRILILYIAIGICIISLSALFPDAILFVLGNKYAHLQKELFYMMCNLVVGSFAAIIWTMNLSRGWVQYSWIYIPSTIITQGLLMYFLKLDTVRAVILFSIISKVPNILLNIGLSVRGFRSLKTVSL